MKTNMKKLTVKRLSLCFVLLALLMSISPLVCSAKEMDTTGTAITAEAAGATVQDATSTKAIASAVTIALASATGAIAMGIAIAKSVEAIGRQPEAESKIRTALMLGLVFVETAIIYALIVAILIIFVL